MHNEIFAWVRLTLFIILILVFALWCVINEPVTPLEQPEPREAYEKEPIYVAQAATYTIIPTEYWKSLGVFELTAYCSCEKCCGQWAKNRPTDQYGNPIVYTATGAIAEAGTTIAVDPNVIPYGSEIQIDGHTYIAQDTGGAIKGNHIDIYFNDHQEALEFGRQQSEIFIKTTGA